LDPYLTLADKVTPILFNSNSYLSVPKTKQQLGNVPNGFGTPYGCVNDRITSMGTCVGMLALKW